jgi:hypothetical protein
MIIIESFFEKSEQVQFQLCIKQCFPKRAVSPLGGCEITWKGAKIRKGRAGALGVGPSECVLRLFAIEVTSDQIVVNWYPFIKPSHRIKNLLTVVVL